MRKEYKSKINFLSLFGSFITLVMGAGFLFLSYRAIISNESFIYKIALPLISLLFLYFGLLRGTAQYEVNLQGIQGREL
jgi:hypothetical protein